MNNYDFYLYIIVALIPISACLVVLQVNPYHALVIRGILGAIAAMIYAILGAGDVALTEALVGTLLAITLYAIAVRSSLVLRLGKLKDDNDSNFDRLKEDIKKVFGKRYMRLEIVPYENIRSLQQALSDREIHATCYPQSLLEKDDRGSLKLENKTQLYQTETRIPRLYDIMRAELASPETNLTYINKGNGEIGNGGF